MTNDISNGLGPLTVQKVCRESRAEVLLPACFWQANLGMCYIGSGDTFPVVGLMALGLGGAAQKTRCVPEGSHPFLSISLGREYG